MGKRSEQVIRANNEDGLLSEEEVLAAAPIMGYGAVKYADLSNVLDKDYTFDFDRMLNFKGNTAVYLLYAYARVQSIFRKCEMLGAEREAFVKRAVLPAIEQPEEWELASHLIKFADMFDVMLLDLHPHHITDYAHGLAERMQKFCGAKNCNVLKSEAALKEARLSLLHLASTTMKTCLNLVGI